MQDLFHSPSCQLFHQLRTNLTYPITTHADCKSNNLIYLLLCTCCSLSDHMNGHCFTTTVSNPDLPVAIHTQSHQIPFQEYWSVSVIHKLPESTLTTFAANLKQHTNSSFNHITRSDSTSVNPSPSIPPSPPGTFNLSSVFLF